MGKVYNIAVIGESMAGKSTWIASLAKENAFGELKKICENNREGQTKISTRYYLEKSDKDKLEVREIKWSEKFLEEYPESGAGRTLEKYFRFPGGREALEEYLEGEEYRVCVSRLDAVSFLEEVVNDEEICGYGFISYVVISCAAGEAVCEAMQKYDLDGVTLVDTRGFLDESKEKMQEYWESLERNRPDNANGKKVNVQEAGNPEKEYLEKLLEDRGLYDVEACVFIQMAGSNALQKKNIREIYEPLFKNLLGKYPVFVVLRESRMTQMLCEGRSYEEAVQCLQKDEYYNGFKTFRKFLKDFGLFDNAEDYRTGIARKHYRELALADIGEENWKKHEDVFKKSAAEALGGVLKAVREYHGCLEEAQRCLTVMIENYSKYQKEVFEEYFTSKITRVSDRNEYVNCNFTYRPKYLAEKVKGEYLGGMIGVRGGLTTRVNGELVGWAAIDFLETAYQMKGDLLDAVIKKLKPDIENYVKQYAGAEVVPEEVIRMQQNLSLAMQRRQLNQSERLFCTERMLCRGYLRGAYDKTREELEVDLNHIGKYLTELKDIISEQEHRDDLCYMSVIKRMLWNLIEASDLN